MHPPFIQLPDHFDEPYLTLNLTDTPALNVSYSREYEALKNTASLLVPFMEITPRTIGPFSKDLTARDDVILALISLFIVLIIESIIATVLLRRRQGTVSNFGFSVKQIIELVKDLNFRRIFYLPARNRHPLHAPSAPPLLPAQQQQQQPPLPKLNIRLLILAFFLFFLTSGLEVAVFFLTNVHQRAVTNSIATFRLLQPVTPEFLNVLIHARVSINRPCEAITIESVHQAATRINGCVDTDAEFSDTALFTPDDARDVVELRIQSRLHKYGADHVIHFDGAGATYKQRTLFTLGDGRSRIMSADVVSPNEEQQMSIVHKQYVAYLFSMFNRAVAKKDQNMSLQRLRDLKFEQGSRTDGGKVPVLQLGGSELKVPTRLYETRVEGVIPHGPAALGAAQHFFRGMAAVVVAEGNTTDMFMDSGVDKSEAVVWEESVRTVNWLSLGVIAALGIVGLGILRWVMNPASTAQIAGVSVHRGVGDGEANVLRSMEMGIGDDDIRYILGAEIGKEGEDEDAGGDGEIKGGGKEYPLME